MPRLTVGWRRVSPIGFRFFEMASLSLLSNALMTDWRSRSEHADPRATASVGFLCIRCAKTGIADWVWVETFAPNGVSGVPRTGDGGLRRLSPGNLDALMGDPTSSRIGVADFFRRVPRVFSKNRAGWPATHVETNQSQLMT